MKTCTHKDCKLKHFAKGFCRKHHARLIRNGRPDGIYNKDGYTDIRGVKDERPGARGYLAVNIINDIKYKAKQRGKSWNLSHEQAFTLITTECNYCPFVPTWPTNRVGIDRVDNEVGYEPDNCVSCCNTCNSAKGEKTLEEFMSWIEAVYTKMNKSKKSA